jgi:hypothetical protein
VHIVSARCYFTEILGDVGFSRDSFMEWRYQSFAVLEKKIFTKKKLKLVDSTGNTQSVDANNSRVVDAAV